MGDIDIAYKQLGNNSSGKQPIVLINGLATSMDMWSPTLLRELSSNHTVIIFDNRGVGKSTTGTKQFSIYQFANDLSSCATSSSSAYPWMLGIDRYMQGILR